MLKLRPELIMFVGLPASGKTTFYEKNYPGYLRLSFDLFRKAVCGQDYYAPLEPYVRSWGEATGRYLMALKTNFVLDTTSLTKAVRRLWLSMAAEYDYNVTCVWFKTPLRTCLKRDAARKRQVGAVIIRRMYNTFEKPSLKEGFSEIIKVWGPKCLK